MKEVKNRPLNCNEEWSENIYQDIDRTRNNDPLVEKRWNETPWIITAEDFMNGAYD